MNQAPNVIGVGYHHEPGDPAGRFHYWVIVYAIGQA
jgi:hypothetical protein